ncbi:MULTISPECIES: sigma-54-dependent Fis family transcriptional regulator [unclassified Pseudomonas]|uniref:sigma-54-dependent Fis family transcriptional regulator n=1 Tax=unclassified Pseudomonas TaxID=196821 RepID=UPI002097C2F0|nr:MULTISPECIES: sigma-54-dependent Fis family transcriptional regulator [unclassified Pseudomonas]MCO7518228.1 sigma-54-dependent Fis family transcriptional regulator [Pseudomonas sp. 1]MCO7541463.1 sigma-54-dependent Fis family transcriptional regulator [Pseudomonas sp. VA159-2]
MARPNTSTPNASDSVQQSRLVRLKLANEGELPSGMLRDEIDASWRRSLSHGLDCLQGEQVGLGTEQGPDLRTLLEHNRQLIDAVTPELDYLVKRQGNSGIVILGDAQANVLAIEGQQQVLAREGLRDLHPGSCWSEALRGTNAIGTAVVEGQPTLINCGEHYLDRLSPFSCTSVPLRDPHGEVIGVLDVTREGVMAQPQDSLSTLLLAAGQIENRLFALQQAEHLVLAFHSRAQYVASAWQGLLALSLDGEVLAANDNACQLLRASRQALLGQPASDLLGERSPGFIARLWQGGVSRAQTARGEFFFRALQVPLQATLKGAVAPPRPASTAKAQALEALAGGDARLARALRMARQGLAGGLPVLLLGETGTGKEVTARALHQAGPRADKPFVAVNCAAIPEGLIESELFGYRDGAFTGARRGGMVGRLLQAHGGTLFLDEIGDMPLALQARLLRVLQERRVAPLGAGDEQDIDVALICATHRDLKRLVAEQRFREDLYYRVNGVSLRLPALRERDDLAPIVQALLDKFGARGVRLDPPLAALLEGFDWPGNIRQLEMVLRAALAMREEGETVLTLDHLTDCLLDELASGAAPSGSLRDNELELIRAALARHQGNVSAAAEALGISRATLYRKLKHLRG